MNIISTKQKRKLFEDKRRDETSDEMVVFRRSVRYVKPKKQKIGAVRRVPKSWLVRFFSWLRIGDWALRLPLWLFILLAVGLWQEYGDLPPADVWKMPQPGIRVTFLDRHGKFLQQKRFGNNEIELSDSLWPDYLEKAVLAVEDKRFWHHGGIDPVGSLRALLANMRTFEVVQSGSTLTQQLAQSLFYDSGERGLARKIQELNVAWWLESNFTKREILQLYLATADFGAGQFGIRAASRHYFQKEALQLTLFEAAILAGILGAPETYRPDMDRLRAVERGAEVLALMRQQGLISAQESADAQFIGHNLSNEDLSSSSIIPESLIGYMRQIIIQNDVTNIQLFTTLDEKLQKLSHDVLRESIKASGQTGHFNRGEVIILNVDGELIAASDFGAEAGEDLPEISSLDEIFAQKRLSLGELITPFIYLAAIEKGYGPASLVKILPVDDRPSSLFWPDSVSSIDLSLHEGFAQNNKKMTIHLIEQIGKNAVAATLIKNGFEDVAANIENIMAGNVGLSSLQLAKMFIPFANGGYPMRLKLVSAIQDSQGEFLNAQNDYASNLPKRNINSLQLSLFNEIMAARLKFLMRDNINILRKQALAGTYGLGYDKNGAWVVGYSAQYVVLVWLGNKSNEKVDEEIIRKAALDMWRHLIGVAHKNLPDIRLLGVYPSKE